MAPRKKTSSMIWVKKSQQSAKMGMLDSSLLPDCVSKLHLSPSAKIAQPAMKDQTFLMGDWSLLPEELLHMISKYLEHEDYCFDVVHARSVCSSWRSIFPFPSCLLRQSYSLPSFAKFPRKTKDLCTLEKIPLFLFRVRAPASHHEYFLGDLGPDKSEDRMERPSPLQCSVKYNIPGTDPTLMNMLDCQIIPLGHQYRMIGWYPDSLATSFRGVAVLPLNKQGGGGGGGGFVVLIGYSHGLLVLRSAERRWIRLEQSSIADCSDILTFRGRFYVVFLNGDIFVFDPYSLEATPLMPPEVLNSGSCNYLVPCGNDELFLVVVIIPRSSVLDFGKLTCRVSKLDEEVGEWVEVSDLGDRVLFIGNQGNVSCSAKELPDGCGVSGNSILFTDGLGFKNFAYKYGVQTGNAEDDLSLWRFSRENLVDVLNKSPPVVALRIER
ncbi:hypothetical protein ISN45_Aa04g004540 [Arabidopsis thaliana x Arabidopsis arenosa]|uniref:F-box domain-containing protein n=1 Tax=Arabidopsis thaliana x Arabidopsis arenosa TaxID=1240361 RepID=A0A8T2A226_9BRAS|nr:hypothetical protein ISN45_Aa04g004540 [Arabidopsis thaliana x Arabidopsis arenosa]KAG7567597.1 hypothetical protein ISN45_Aa04g004540 [Arabidopsis thaliana x Arabidopsis arenosa]